jgi:ADP-heptose:LPS heptosyltransferase
MSALSAAPSSNSVDWLVAHEFATLLDQHSRIRKVWSFDRRSGFKGWKALGLRLWEEGYDEVYDLHRTLRTKLLKLLFLYWSFTRSRNHSEKLLAGNRLSAPIWHVISKQRLRLYGYFVFKSLWPKAFRPESVCSRSARLVGGKGSEKPDARHLLVQTGDADRNDEPRTLLSLKASLHGKSYICVMPGSKWAGKKWPVAFYAELISKLQGYVPVVMGAPSDRESVELVRLLQAESVPVISAVGAWNLREVAQILSGAWRYLGNDTGLGHLAEAVGVPSYVIFGPTREDMGFGPWRPESRAVGKSMACRPCGKDGRHCYRLGQRYACMSRLKPQEVLTQIPEIGDPKTVAKTETEKDQSRFT